MNLQSLHEALSPQQVSTDPSILTAFSVDGVSPKTVVYPTSLSQAAEVIKLANAKNWAVVPWGGGTKMGLGGVPTRVDLVLSTSRLDKIIDIDTANLTVTAQAGVRLGDLQDLLGGSENRCYFPVDTDLKKQADYMCSARDYKGVFLPMDPPFADRATLGGIVSSNSTGPRRLRYGHPRDLVLGVRYVAPTGEIIGMGGKTVKNVSGYDVSKIMVGALGTLGLLGDLTCRLLPLPEQVAAMLVCFGTLGAARNFSDRVLNSKLLPTSLEMLNARAYNLAASAELNVEPTNWVVAIGLEGFSEEVRREVGDLKVMARQENASDLAELNKDEASVFWKNLTDCSATAAKQGRAVVKFRGSFLISHYADILDAWLTASEGTDCALMASPGLGLAHAYFFDATDADLEKLARLGTAFRSAAEVHGGSVVVECAPASLKRNLDPWGGLRGDFVLMKRIKERVDPLGVMNPGRFVGGL